MTKQNTAIICLSPNFGGMEIDAIKLSQKLSCHTNVITIAKKNSFIANNYLEYITNDSSLIIETIDFNSSISLSIYLKTKQIIKKHNIKNIIFFGASELKSLYFSFLGLDINLIIRHGTAKTRPKKDLFHKLIYSSVNYHIAVSHYLEKNIKTIIPIGKNTKIKVIYPSIKAIDMTNEHTNEIRIVHTGRIASGKGQLDAILACEILYLNKIDFNLNILGNFENQKYKQEFMKIYNSLAYKNKINLIGFTSDVNSFLSSSNIFLFPSYGEGFGNSFIEALNNGLVGISYNNTTFLEFSDLGLYFHKVENKNMQQLQQALLNIANNMEDELKKSITNRDIIQNVFSVENEIMSYLEILI